MLSEPLLTHYVLLSITALYELRTRSEYSESREVLTHLSIPKVPNSAFI